MVFARANLPQIEETIHEVALAILNDDVESASLIAASTQIAPFVVDNLLDLFASRGWLRVSNTIGDKHVFSISPSMKRALA